MASVAHSDDSRFDEAEADVERGEPWRYRDGDAPNPLTIEVTGWSTGHTKLGEAEFLNGVDRDGNEWSVLVGSVVLKKRLIEGLVEEWSDEENGYVVVDRFGRVQVGEVVSMKYLGDGESATGNAYPRFSVSRKPLQKPEESDDDIPF
jgi:hypothetical protein